MDGRKEPACHKDARRVLTYLRIPHSDVIRVDADSVLYLTPDPKEPRTLWLHRDPQTQHLSHRVEVGFQGTPPRWPQSSPKSSPSSDPSPPQQ